MINEHLDPVDVKAANYILNFFRSLGLHRGYIIINFCNDKITSGNFRAGSGFLQNSLTAFEKKNYYTGPR